MNMSRFQVPIHDNTRQRQAAARAYTAHIERDDPKEMRYGPCSHRWSEPDKNGVRECVWCYCREKVVDLMKD